LAWKLDLSRSGSTFDRPEPAHHQRRFDAAVFAEGKLFDEKLVEGFQSGNFTALKHSDARVDDLDRAGHLEAIDTPGIGCSRVASHSSSFPCVRMRALLGFFGRWKRLVLLMRPVA
jgi:hypothetical protein